MSIHILGLLPQLLFQPWLQLLLDELMMHPKTDSRLVPAAWGTQPGGQLRVKLGSGSVEHVYASVQVLLTVQVPLKQVAVAVPV